VQHRATIVAPLQQGDRVAVIKCAEGWKGLAVRGGWANHESNFTEDDMITLAGQIVNVEGMSGLEPANMNALFKRVRNALASATDKISITKGIHQRDSKAHFDIEVSNGDGSSVSPVFHVFVKPGVEQIVEGGKTSGGTRIKRKLAEYIPSGLSVKSGVILTWPSQFQLVDLEKPVGRPRGYSFNVGNSQAPANFAEMTKGQSAFHKTFK
jgi:hypothetical protein